ncbi:MAG: IS1 family transposase [Planctomycetota bacterium]|nr:IS1 family transposase [Planctomycetota bacterium]
MNKLNTADRVRVVSALVEGNSIRATVRMTGVAKNTVAKLLVDLGKACAEYHDKHVRNVKAARIQCDEIWSFCYAKQKNVPAALQGKFAYGDVWTWTAVDANSKLIVSYMVGLRDGGYATEFIRDVASRLANRVQLTTDGHRAYLEAVEDAFGGDIDYAQLVKVYGAERPGEARYSPAVCLAANPTPICADPDRRYTSTSYIERQNLTMRMSLSRMTRLSNGFSKKVENLTHAIAIHFMHYNFCRIHQSLRVTPAMEAGLMDHVWEIDELVSLVETGRRPPL